MFFEKFDQLADAPNAVAKMRELILHLAVHGKLVEQLEGDEPASELLIRSRAEMAGLIASGKAKSEKPALPVSEEEVTFSLPSGWVWCRLVDAGQFINGLAFKPSDWGTVGRPIIRIQNLSGRNPEFNRTTRDFDPSVLVQDRDILVSWSATLDAFIWRGEEGVLNQHIFRVLPAPLADKGYLFWLLKWVIRQLAESDHAHGLVMSHINRGPFLARPIPLPPLAEQKRIVAKLDALMTLCDRLEAQQQERDTRYAALARASLARFAEASTPADLDFLFHHSYTINPADLRKSILTLAVEGYLVERDISGETVSELLEKEGIVMETFDNAPALPEHWALVRLGKITTRMDSGWSPACSPDSAPPEAWGVLKTTAVQALEYQEHQNKTLPPNLAPRPEHEVMDGDILFTRAGPMNRVGILCVARPTRAKLMISDKIIRFHLIPLVDPDFAALALNAGFSSSVIEGLKSGMAASQVNISQPKLKSVPIPIPPLVEQHRIVAKVDQLMALVDRLESQLTASRTTAEKLMEAVVAELTTSKVNVDAPIPARSSIR